jgi:hypothetical protein
MRTEIESYRQELLVALRLRDVPGRRIAEALAEVDSHVAESGESPEEAFGPASAYAAELAGALDPARPTGWRAVVRASLTWTVPLAMAGGYLAADGAFSLGVGEDAVFGLPAGWCIAVGVLLLAVVGYGSRPRERDRVVDPRTGREVSLGSASFWGPVAAAGVPVLVLLGLYALGRLLA